LGALPASAVAFLRPAKQARAKSRFFRRYVTFQGFARRKKFAPGRNGDPPFRAAIAGNDDLPLRPDALWLAAVAGARARARLVAVPCQGPAS
jgi:hypothetical protein